MPIKNSRLRRLNLRVALVHEFLVQLGGAERILAALSDLFPQADIYTLICNEQRFRLLSDRHKIYPSFIQKLPLGVAQYKKYLALMPKAIESFNFDGYDLVISDASSFAKGAITHPPTIHVCYCHTPTRFIWLETEYYVKTTGVPRWLGPVVIRLLKKMRQWDYRAAKRPDIFIANSKNVQNRIKTIYHRDSQVVHPFVNIANFSPAKRRLDYYLIGGRLVQYKRYDLVIQAFNQLNRPLVVFGDGQDRLVLENLVKHRRIKFIGRVADHQLRSIYGQARAFIYPGEEDFGIQPLESMACGVPVIAYGQGGALETVVDGQTGLFFYEQTVESIIETIKRFEQLSFSPAKVRQRALSFSKEKFMLGIESVVAQALSRRFSRPR